MKRLTGLLALVACAGIAMRAEALDFYVSPQGSDQADGLTAQAGGGHGPFLSPARAQRAVRELKAAGRFSEGVRVHLAAGEYRLTDSLNFDLRDGGLPGREVAWQADGEAVFSGGRAVRGCAADGAGLWRCALPAAAVQDIHYLRGSGKQGDVPGFNVFVNGQRLHLARWPDQGWAHIRLPLDESSRFSSMEPLPAVDAAQVQTHIFPGSDWNDEYLPVATVDPASNQVTLGAATNSPLVSGRRFYLQNFRAGLDAPGEWFYDRERGELLFLPPAGLMPERVEISATPTLLKLDGAGNLRFQGLAFRYCTGTCIDIRHGDGITLAQVDMGHIDGTAIQADASVNISLRDSHLYDLGESGIITSGGDRNTLQASGNTIDNNHIHDFGVILLRFSPAVESKGVGSRISHNLMEHGAGLAISLNGNDHLIEKNEIHHVCEQLSDCGAIYSGRNWTWRGNVVRYNSVHDVYGYGMLNVDPERNTVSYGSPNGARGVYLDDGMSGFTVYGNLFYRAGITIHIGGGRDNRIENNFIYSDDYAVLLDNRGPGYDWEANNRATLRDVPYQSPLWLARYPALATPIMHADWPTGNVITHNIMVCSRELGLHYSIPSVGNTIADNLVWTADGKFSVDFDLLDRGLKQQAANWAEWLATGVETGSRQADPCASVNGNRLRFCANSPAAGIGFAALPDDIGLHKRD